ncbi:MAG: cell division suppressor protein YneA [Bacillota bacterium]
MKKHMIRRRFNPVKFFRGIGLVIILAVTMTFFIKGSATGTLQTGYKQITVKKGDTIWEIARDNKNGGTDIEEVIYAIKQANKIKNSGLYPGQVIKVPLNF